MTDHIRLPLRPLAELPDSYDDWDDRHFEHLPERTRRIAFTAYKQLPPEERAVIRTRRPGWLNKTRTIIEEVARTVEDIPLMPSQVRDAAKVVIFIADTFGD